MNPHSSAVLLLQCPDQRGIVAAVSEFIFRHGGNILHADEHADLDSNLYLMRVEFDAATFDIPLTPSRFAAEFATIAERFHMDWRLATIGQQPRMAIFVSKYDHCLADLLHRHSMGELRCQISFILSNHADNQRMAEFYGIPYHVTCVNQNNKPEAEMRQRALIAEQHVDFLVLARYMQVLSNEFVAAYPNRIINIHHSFLPAFIGAKPYHQAFERGVKLIGATAHYVTAVLDDGPIIDQNVVRISHRDRAEDLVQKGRDIEKTVLSRAVRWHIENRILVFGNKTVVFE